MNVIPEWKNTHFYIGKFLHKKFIKACLNVLSIRTLLEAPLMFLTLHVDYGKTVMVHTKFILETYYLDMTIIIRRLCLMAASMFAGIVSPTVKSLSCIHILNPKVFSK